MQRPVWTPSSSPTLAESVQLAHTPASGLQARFVPGAVLSSRYRIVTPLGRGGMGEVYRAEDLRLGQTVALKFLPVELTRVPSAWAHIEREVRIGRQISHPNVCRMFDIGEAESGPFITMEFIDGEDLASLLKRIGRLPVDKGLQVAHQLCAGLAAAHEFGIVHRDLKPANIMLDGRGRVRITDFGLAALFQELHANEMRAGTPSYMAPEQITGAPVTPRTDIYAAGLVIYEMLAGHPAFPPVARSNLQQRLKEIPVRISKYVKGLDPAIERIVLRCLEPDPAARPASATEVALALPGADPLRAAVEAGETPSPDTVAAAGEPVTISTAATVALLAAVLIGIICATALARYASVLGASRGGKPPEALAERAREVIAHFGYEENAADSAWWFEPNGEQLASSPPGTSDVMRFVYRQSPRPMIPQNLYGLVERDDPPADVPGMITVELNTSGRLREFTAVPVPESPDSSSDRIPPGGHGSKLYAALPAAKSSEWGAALFEAGLDSPMPSPANPRVVPPTAFDARQDWRTGTSNEAIAVSAANFHGKPVFFRAAPLQASSARVGTRGRGLSSVMFVVAVAVVGVGGSLLARRNMRRGRGDRQGAFRVAAFLFIAELAGWALSAHFVPVPADEYFAFIGGCGEALYVAGFMWVLYMAAEPYARRRWPEMLISWQRVIAGKLYDPRVGRDILLGAIGGTGMAIVLGLVNALPAWFHLDNIAPSITSPLTLRGPTGMMAVLFLHSSQAVQWALATISFLLVARVITRRDWLAVGLSGVCLGMVVLPADNFALAFTASMLSAAIIYSLLFRFGLLSVAVALFFNFVLRRWPVSLDFSHWFVWRSVFSIAVLVGIAGYAFLAVNIGRPIFNDATLEG